MTTLQFPPTTPEPTEPEAPPAVVDTDAELANLAIDTIHATAVGVARLCRASSDELPRLCVAAACRTVERLTAKPEGYPVARLAAVDLLRALHEALNKTEALVRFIDQEAPHD